MGYKMHFNLDRYLEKKKKKKGLNWVVLFYMKYC